MLQPNPINNLSSEKRLHLDPTSGIKETAFVHMKHNTNRDVILIICSTPASLDIEVLQYFDKTNRSL